MNLAQWTARIGAWHERAFAWARLPHIADKLHEERQEAVTAWAMQHRNDTADELADCLICVLAMFAREGIDVEAALASKFARVVEKYEQAQRPAAEPELPL